MFCFIKNLFKSGSRSRSESSLASASRSKPEQARKNTAGGLDASKPRAKNIKPILSFKNLFSAGNSLLQENLSKLEELLLMADIGYETTQQIILKIKQTSKELGKNITEGELKHLIGEEITNILKPLEIQGGGNILSTSFKEQKLVIFTGVNGSGKTTSIGKLAYQYNQAGKKLAVAACDTFRAAAKEQLLEWSKRAGTKIIMAKQQKQDPASVAYEAMEVFIKENLDVILIDTAGRLHNNVNLMAELGKIKRITQKFIADRANISSQTILVLDATTGQNMLRQVEAFQKVIDISGLIITKFDGSSKAGAIIAIARKFKIPIHILGVGEKIEDAKIFRTEDFVKKLLG